MNFRNRIHFPMCCIVAKVSWVGSSFKDKNAKDILVSVVFGWIAKLSWTFRKVIYCAEFRTFLVVWFRKVTWKSSQH